MGLMSNLLEKVGGKRGGLQVSASFEASSEILSSPTFVDGPVHSRGVVFGTKTGTVYFLNEDYSVKWSHNIQEKISDVEMMFMDPEHLNSISASPAAADINKDGRQEIIVGSELGRVYALSSSGNLLWSFQCHGAIRSSPVLEDINGDGKPEILVGSGDRQLYALDGKGKLLWKFLAKSGIECSPLVYKSKKNTQIIFGANDGLIYSISPQGKLLWEYKTGSKITATPVSGQIYGDSKDFIVVGSHDTYLYVLNPEGALEWQYKTDGRIISAAVLADVNDDSNLEIIFGSCDDNLYVLTSSGTKLWSFETDFWVVPSPIIADIDGDGNQEIVIASYDHSLYVLESEGAFLLDYMPGISSATAQTGSYTDLMTAEPGQYCGKELWRHKADGMIVGTAKVIQGKSASIVLATHKGKLEHISHIKK